MSLGSSNDFEFIYMFPSYVCVCRPLCVLSPLVVSMFPSLCFPLVYPVCHVHPCLFPSPAKAVCLSMCLSVVFLFYFESLLFSFTSPVSLCLIPLSCVPMCFLVSVWVHTTILSIYDHDKLKSPMARMWSG